MVLLELFMFFSNIDWLSRVIFFFCSVFNWDFSVFDILFVWFVCSINIFWSGNVLNYLMKLWLICFGSIIGRWLWICSCFIWGMVVILLVNYDKWLFFVISGLLFEKIILLILLLLWRYLSILSYWCLFIVLLV